MQIVEGIIGVVTLLAILSFVLYVIGLFRLPTGRRPSTSTFDRYGDPLPPEPNPNFRETEYEGEGS